jgi:hypothetical protein
MTANEKQALLDKLAEERDQLDGRCSKLFKFIMTPAFTALDEKQQELLSEQHTYMVRYLGALRKRIDLVAKQESTSVYELTDKQRDVVKAAVYMYRADYGHARSVEDTIGEVIKMLETKQ